MHFSFTIKIAVGVYVKMFMYVYLLFLVSFCAYDLQTLREVGLGYERWTLPNTSIVRMASFDFSSD
jgi:hypothetical protein